MQRLRFISYPFFLPLLSIVAEILDYSVTRDILNIGIFRIDDERDEQPPADDRMSLINALREYRITKSTVCRTSCTEQGIVREIFGCVKSVRKSYADYTARNILAYLHYFNEYDENIKKYIYIYIICILLSFS